MEKKKTPENATKYGEFVCSNYHWIPIDKQKKNTKKIENMTNNKKNEENESK